MTEKSWKNKTMHEIVYGTPPRSAKEEESAREWATHVTCADIVFKVSLRSDRGTHNSLHRKLANLMCRIGATEILTRTEEITGYGASEPSAYMWWHLTVKANFAAVVRELRYDQESLSGEVNGCKCPANPAVVAKELYGERWTPVHIQNIEMALKLTENSYEDSGTEEDSDNNAY